MLMPIPRNWLSKPNSQSAVRGICHGSGLAWEKGYVKGAEAEVVTEDSSRVGKGKDVVVSVGMVEGA
jgi:hypothetical protein